MKASDTGFIQGVLQGLIPFNKIHQESLEKCIKILQHDFHENLVPNRNYFKEFPESEKDLILPKTRREIDGK